uniref:Uncharacterized protein n=1 Tax=Arundo donax TaxID=35708 RepID=A0A0A8Z732_ARUDO
MEGPLQGKMLLFLRSFVLSIGLQYLHMDSEGIRLYLKKVKELGERSMKFPVLFS